MAGIRDLRLGRLWLPTVNQDVAESVGDQLETVGGGVVPGERRARPFTVTIPLHGTPGDDDPYAIGDRMRRQIRALMENTRLKLQTTYFAFAIDPELNAWLVVGAADLSYADGGKTLADYTLQLSDSYKVGSRRTHRAARRIELYDRRKSTTPRDLLGLWFGTDWAGVTALPLIYLPVGVTDVVGAARRLVTFGVRPSLGGDIAVVALPSTPTADVNHGEVLSFELLEASLHEYDDVVIFDRRGGSDPASGFAARVLASSPRGFWRLGEAAGETVATDTSDYLNNGSYIGVPNLQQPPAITDPNLAAGLRGDLGVYVRVPDSSSLRITGDLTIVGWLNLVPGTPNLVMNPSFEVDTENWTGAVTGRVSSWAADGTWAARVTGTQTNNDISAFNDRVAIAAGTQISARAEVNVIQAVANPPAISIEWFDAGLSLLGQSTGTAASAGTGIKTITSTGTAPASTAYFRIRIVASTVGTQTADYYIDAVTAVVGPTPLPVSATSPRYETIASKWLSAAAKRAYRLVYDRYRNELALDLSSDGSAISTAWSVGAAASAPGIPTFFAVVYEAATGRATFYRNGIGVSAATGLPTSIYAATTKFVIGKLEGEA